MIFGDLGSEAQRFSVRKGLLADFLVLSSLTILYLLRYPANSVRMNSASVKKIGCCQSFGFVLVASEPTLFLCY